MPGFPTPARRLCRVPAGALPAMQVLTQVPFAAFFGDDPGTLAPGRVVPHMPGMTAGKVRDPVAVFILMKSDNALFHGGQAVRHMARSAYASPDDGFKQTCGRNRRGRGLPRAFVIQHARGGAVGRGRGHGAHMAQKVLIVDDEPAIVDLVRHHLEKEGLQCLEASEGDTALRLARAEHPDVLVLDLMLPGVDGLEICRLLRRDTGTAKIAIIMLTARAEEVDRVVGLEMGADDYVVKPFSPRELVARVKAVLRRGRDEPAEAVRRAGGIEIDEAKYQVRAAGRVVKLTAKEFDLLRELMRANGRVLKRERMLEMIWGYANAEDIESRTVDVHIRRLREKLGDESRRIVTVTGVGYRFEADG